ncbi:MAG: allantoate amidohydrolase [Planctomycetota bacterium]
MSETLEQQADTVMTRCDELARCSDDADGITRLFLSSAMQKAHKRVRGWMEAAELQTHVDDAGNVIGRTKTAIDRAVVLGSHLDSVPGGGRYDGVLGVLIALAVAEQLGDESLPFRLDVIGFSEEEGVRYRMPYLGSAARMGRFDPEWLDRTDAEDLSMREAMRRFGLDAEKIDEAAYASDEVIAYIEPHLEQGPMLENANRPLGVVSGIAGQTRIQLEFIGTAGHAGTTPMLGRSDALAMAAQLVTDVNSIGRQTKGLRATVGQLSVSPNAPNVIPQRVQMSLDVRHVDDLVRERALNDMLAAGRQIAKTAYGKFAVREQVSQTAVAMDDGLSDILTDAARDCGHEPLQLFSGAGHDAVVVAKKFPAAMLFLRHPGGVSHHPDERVLRDDVAAAIEVMCQLVRKLAAKHEPKQVGTQSQ